MRPMLLVIGMLAAFAAHARADCVRPTLAGYPSQWPEAAVSYPADADARTKLGLLRQSLENSARSQGVTETQKVSLLRVAHFIEEKLAELRAKQPKTVDLGFLQPRVCSAAIENGVPVPTCAWEVLADPSVKVPPAASSEAWDCTFEAQFAGYVRSSAQLLAVFADHINDQIARALVRYDQAWTNLINDGYSQYPWEVLLNGAWLNHKRWGPSPNLAVLLHPAVGAGVANLNHKHGEAVAAAIVSVEAAGYLRYFANHKHYVGAGLTGTMNNLQGQQIGLGVVLHASGFSLGISRDFWNAHKDELTVFWLLDVGRTMDDNFLAKKIPKLIKDHTLSPALLETP
jgi:hypothetical protein